MELRKNELLKTFDVYLVNVSASKDLDRLIELQMMLEGRLIEIERRKIMACLKCKTDLTEDDYRYGRVAGICRICQINEIKEPAKVGVGQ